MSNNQKELRYTLAKDIPDQGDCKEKINSRSTPTFLYSTVVGLLICLMKFKYSILIGVTMSLISIVCFFLMKNEIVLETYEKSMICYHVMDTSKAVCIQYKDVETWDVDSEKSMLNVVLKDGSFLQHFCPRGFIAYEALNKVMPDKRKLNSIQKALKKK